MNLKNLGNNKNMSKDKVNSNLKAGEVSKNINGNQLKKENKNFVAKSVNFFKNDDINLLEPKNNLKTQTFNLLEPINKTILPNFEKIVKNIKIILKKNLESLRYNN